jgi:cysteinyl-tRNA synthetase
VVVHNTHHALAECCRTELQESDPRVDALVASREAACARRDFGEADRRRNLLAAEGIVIQDTPKGPRWRRR